MCICVWGVFGWAFMAINVFKTDRPPGSRAVGKVSSPDDQVYALFAEDY